MLDTASSCISMSCSGSWSLVSLVSDVLGAEGTAFSGLRCDSSIVQALWWCVGDAVVGCWYELWEVISTLFKERRCSRKSFCRPDGRETPLGRKFGKMLGPFPFPRV